MSGLDARLAALAEAVELGRGRFDVGAAEAVVRRAGVRLGLGVETTVVALAGPTGAGKSSLFNALAGQELSAAGVRRPTTGTVSAAIWGPVGGALLDWLGVARRHVVEPAGDGLVLLDLPDYDSVADAHRREVDRVVELADLLVWVTDPQKYADAALHDGYLRRLAGHGDAMAFVLNQADRLDARALAACLGDARRLLAEDGLSAMPVLAVSARTGDGVDALRDEVRGRVAARTAAVARLEADVRAAAAPLATGCAGRARGGVGRRDREALTAALAQAAGVPTVADAVGAAHRRAGGLATGWPYGRWLARLKPDPLKRLRVGDAAVRTSLPRATPVQRAQVSSATRTLAANASEGLPDPWPRLVRDAAGAHEAAVPDRLDRVVAGSIPTRPGAPRWWAAAAAGQRLLAVVAGIGALWLALLAVLGYLQLDGVVPTPDVGKLPVPTLVLAAGVLGGLLLAAVARSVNRAGARRRAARARKVLDEGVQAVGAELVVAPVEAELAARERLCAALATARGG